MTKESRIVGFLSLKVEPLLRPMQFEGLANMWNGSWKESRRGPKESLIRRDSFLPSSLIPSFQSGVNFLVGLIITTREEG